MRRVVCVLLGTAACMLVLVLLTRPAAAVPQTRFVATDGSDTSTCISTLAPCLTVQYAVNQAVEGDEIRVAGGTYGSAASPNPIVAIAKTVTMTGGYSRADGFATSDPVARGTTIEAGLGGTKRAITITNSSPVISGFTIRGGRAPGSDGGNLHIVGGSPVIANSIIENGFAEQRGGGIFVADSSATFLQNTIRLNRTMGAVPYVARGGGVYVLRGAPMFTNNTIVQNSVESYPLPEPAPQVATVGGGIVLESDASVLTANTIISNTVAGLEVSACRAGPIARGGGVLAQSSRAILTDNIIRGNSATGGSVQTCPGGQARAGGYAIGGGIAIDLAPSNSQLQVIGGVIQGNEAKGGVPLSGGSATVADPYSAEAYGGGISVSSGANPIIRGVTIISNTATGNLRNGAQTGGSNGYGGGIYAFDADPVLDRLTIRGNTARSLDPGRFGFGGGIYLEASSVVTSAQNLALVENSARNGGAIMLTSNATLRVSQITIARTISPGSSILVVNGATAAITNAIFASNATGIDTSITLPVNGVLFFDTVTKTVGPVVLTNEVAGDPLLAADFIHLQSGSAAVNSGVVSGVPNDLDNQLRPQGAAYDLGADEYQAVASLTIAGPSAGQVGATLTFTASIVPATAPGPITYTWTATGQPPVTRVSGTSDSISYSWPDTGQKTIQVTAQNAIPGASISTNVTISTDPPPPPPPPPPPLPPGTTNVIAIGVVYAGRDGP